ncbi:MAG TPA: hypothetical protein VJ917_06565 [Saprospiraceae bacterium]|nr:hypothetical protein [Saprospiraceae bacterium]
MKVSILSIFLITIAFQQLDAQQFRSLVQKSPKAERILVKSLESSVVMIEHQFQLLGDSSRRYGRDSSRYFGKECALGIWVDSFLVLDTSVLEPWLKDSLFLQQYESNDSLTPVTGQMQMYKAGSETPDTLQMIVENTISMEAYQFLILKDTVKHKSKTGLKYQIPEGAVVIEPFFILGYETPNADSVKLKLKVHFSPLLRSNPESKIKNVLSAPELEGLLGGYYIEPIVTENKVEFYFRGFLRQSGQLFTMHPLDIDQEAEETSSSDLFPLNEN